MFWIWSAFIGFVLAMLALDLGVFHRKAHAVKTKEALAWSAVWIALALAFTGVVYLGYERAWGGLGSATDLMSVSDDNPLGRNDGRAAALKFLTGYVIEKSLSVDNIFVIAMIFGMMKVPALYRHRVLFWGILGALLMRGVMIALGAKLIASFSWVLYVFAAILLVTGVKMLLVKEDEADPDPAGSSAIRWARRALPVAEGAHGESFFVRAADGAWKITPLFLALLAVEFSDLIFAVDSIPAIFAITTDPFLVFTSNVFAILGLRSLYFALEGMLDAFHHLKTALAVVLILVAFKMLFHGWLKTVLGGNFNLWILGVVFAILAGGVVASRLFPKNEAAKG